jgi:hypothetical protein
MEMLIHLCDYASQPDIHLVCTNTWTIPKWCPDPNAPDTGVYESDEGLLYTFEKSLVSCPECYDPEH